LAYEKASRGLCSLWRFLYFWSFPKRKEMKPSRNNNFYNTEKKGGKMKYFYWKICIISVVGFFLCITTIKAQDFVCSGRIDTLKMIWDGPGTLISVNTDLSSEVIITHEGVDQVVIVGYPVIPVNDLTWHWTSDVSSGFSTFHVSCSDDDMNGPEDCGKPQGDGKDQADFENFWLLDGLATDSGFEFDCTPPATDAILTFFDDSVADGSLIGDGPGNSANGRLNALRNILEMADDLIYVNDIEGACTQLYSALRKCDGVSPPPDFVAGSAAEGLYNMILDLMTELGCE
jgi:hypothetical protein